MNTPMALTAAHSVGDSALSFPAPAVPIMTIMTAEELLADTKLCNEWDALAAQASEPNPFAERWYLAAALNALHTAHVSIAVVRDTHLIGIMALGSERRYAGLPIAHWQNWLNHNAFLGTPLVKTGAEQAFWQTLLAYLDHGNNGRLFLHLNSLHIAGPVAEALSAVCQNEKRRYARVHYEERAFLERGLSPDAYWESNVRGKKRKELRRQHKRLAEEGTLSFERSNGSTGLDAWTADFLTLEKAGWKGANGSALDCAEDTRALFATALNGAAKAGKLELLTLRLDGRAIAMLANFLTPPGAFSFKTAFDEGYSRYSPGVLLQIENLALLERDGIDWCDSCAAQDHPMIDSLWSGRRGIGRYSVAIGGIAKRAAFAALLAAEQAKAKFKSKAKA
jgi:CelD/BcsL family acetyltransferase involved in cellulose biosynthesis